MLLMELLGCFAGACCLGALTGAAIDVFRRRNPRFVISTIIIGGVTSSFSLIILYSPWVQDRVDNASLLGSDFSTKMAILLSGHIYLVSVAAAIITVGFFRLAFPTRDKQGAVVEPPVQDGEDKGPVYRSLALNRALLVASEAGMGVSILAQVVAVALPAHASSSEYAALWWLSGATIVALLCNTKSRFKAAASPNQPLLIRIASACIVIEVLCLIVLHWVVDPDSNTDPYSRSWFVIWTIGNPAYQSLRLLMN